MTKFISTLIFILALLTGLSTQAAVPKWQIIPDKSSIKFTGTQNNAPVAGEFKQFSGDIRFDANQLKDSQIKLVVDMNSVSAGFKELADILKSTDWFDTSDFAKATFESREIVQTKPNLFDVKGELTVRDKKAPITLEVELDENSPTMIRLHGTTMLKRTAFGVGQGDWSSTSEVKDDVAVKFVLTLKKANEI